jgi:hypothetical protein
MDMKKNDLFKIEELIINIIIFLGIDRISFLYLNKMSYSIMEKYFILWKPLCNLSEFDKNTKLIIIKNWKLIYRETVYKKLVLETRKRLSIDSFSISFSNSFDMIDKIKFLKKLIKCSDKIKKIGIFFDKLYISSMRNTTSYEVDEVGYITVYNIMQVTNEELINFFQKIKKDFSIFST